ncbi:MAG: hypothetical protein ACRCVJ_00920 [Clostridium sp.]|uniref:hypothetical protein n=1 Tax=Clostridium sp. TaxID=1506 RepID=UPI003F2DDBC4
MNSLKKFILIFTISILSIVLLLFLTYKISFEPKTPVVSINSNLELNSKSLIKKFIPNDIDLSLKGVKFNSDVSLNEEELTSIILNSLDKTTLSKNNIEGINILIRGDQLFFYLDFRYKNIPLQAVLNFDTYAKDGDAILHYNYGKIGFINIPEKYIKNILEENQILHFDKDNNLIISLHRGYGIYIDDTKLDNSSLNIKFHIDFKFFS